MDDDLKTQRKEMSDGLRDPAATVNNFSAKFDEIAVKVDRLAPLAPMASKLAALPDKIVALQAAAFENTQEVRALNLAVIRVESAQHDGKAPAGDDEETAVHSVNGPPKHGSKPPPRPHPPLFRPEPPPFRPDPRDQWREEEDDIIDSCFHPRVRLKFPSYDGKEDPLPWLNRCETFFRGQNTLEPAVSSTRRCTSPALQSYGIAGWSSRPGLLPCAASPSLSNNASGRR